MDRESDRNQMDDKDKDPFDYGSYMLSDMYHRLLATSPPYRGKNSNKHI